LEWRVGGAVDGNLGLWPLESRVMIIGASSSFIASLSRLSRAADVARPTQACAAPELPRLPPLAGQCMLAGGEQAGEREGGSMRTERSAQSQTKRHSQSATDSGGEDRGKERERERERVLLAGFL